MSTAEMVIAVLGSSVVATLVNQLFAVVQKINEKKDSRTTALKLLMLDCIERKAKELISNSCCTIQELNAFKEMYQNYKDLNGDGYADIWNSLVLNLPIK